jgi:hypothetical protein
MQFVLKDLQRDRVKHTDGIAVEAPQKCSVQCGDYIGVD